MKGLADGGADLGVTHHVPVGGPTHDLKCRSQRGMVIEDRDADPVAEFLVGVDVLFELGILEGPADRIACHADQEVGSMIVGAAHRDVELDLESRRSHFLHGLELVEDVFKRREVVFQPGVASP